MGVRVRVGVTVRVNFRMFSEKKEVDGNWVRIRIRSGYRIAAVRQGSSKNWNVQWFGSRDE